MIKTRLVNLITSVSALKQLSDVPVSGKVAFQISRLISSVEFELEHFEEARKTILAKYGERDDNDEIVVKDNGDVVINDPEGYNKEIAELLNTEIEINASPIPVVALENLQMTPSAASALKDLVE